MTKIKEKIKKYKEALKVFEEKYGDMEIEELQAKGMNIHMTRPVIIKLREQTH